MVSVSGGVACRQCHQTLQRLWCRSFWHIFCTTHMRAQLHPSSRQVGVFTSSPGREKRGEAFWAPPPTPLTSPTFSWHPSVQPAVSRSSTVLPCGLRAQPTMWCCGAAGRGLVQLSHSSAADCQPGPARPGSARLGPAAPPNPELTSPEQVQQSRCPLVPSQPEIAGAAI